MYFIQQIELERIRQEAIAQRERCRRELKEASEQLRAVLERSRQLINDSAGSKTDVPWTRRAE
jgi:hypothetical protein